MGRKAAPRVPSAGEVVSWFESVPVELAATVAEIVSVRIGIRRAQRDLRLLTPAADVDGSTPREGKKRGRKLKPEAAESA